MSEPIGSAVTNTNPNSCVTVQCARIGKPWQISPGGIEFTAQWEAFRPQMYDHDGAGGGGNATIGYGHLVHLGPISGAPSEVPYLNGITEVQGRQLLRHDVSEPERIVNNRINVPLFQYEYDAIVDFVYNHRSHNDDFF